MKLYISARRSFYVFQTPHRFQSQEKKKQVVSHSVVRSRVFLCTEVRARCPHAWPLTTNQADLLSCLHCLVPKVRTQNQAWIKGSHPSCYKPECGWWKLLRAKTGTHSWTPHPGHCSEPPDHPLSSPGLRSGSESSPMLRPHRQVQSGGSNSAQPDQTIANTFEVLFLLFPLLLISPGSPPHQPCSRKTWSSRFCSMDSWSTPGTVSLTVQRWSGHQGVVGLRQDLDSRLLEEVWSQVQKDDDNTLRSHS